MPQDLVWDQMEILFGRVVTGTNAHKKRNRAVKDLKLLGAGEDTIRYAYEQYLARFSGAICTDIALATHYPLLVDAELPPPTRRYGRGVTAQELGDQVRREVMTNGTHPGQSTHDDPARGLPRGGG